MPAMISCCMLALFDEVVPAIPDRPREAVESELDDIRDARRAGGRAGGAGPKRGRKG